MKSHLSGQTCGRLWRQAWLIGSSMLILALSLYVTTRTQAQNLQAEFNGTIPVDVSHANPSSFPVRLQKQPTVPVTVTFTITPSTPISQIKLTPSVLKFDKTNWNITKTVTITVIASSDDGGPHTLYVGLSATNDKQLDLLNLYWVKVAVLDKKYHNYLSMVRADPTPTPTPPPTWRAVGGAGHDVGVLASNGNELFIGDRRTGGGGGVYHSALSAATCGRTPVDFGNTPLFSAQILALTFRDGRGMAGTFGDKIFYSTDNGNSWSSTRTKTNPYVYGVLFTDNPTKSYAGADNGVYLSTDSGQTWSNPLANGPDSVNTLYGDGTLIWVGTFGKGIWKFDIGPDTPAFAQVGALTGEAAKVWAVLKDSTSGKYYIGTNSGVYQGDGVGAWSSLGLSDKAVYSLALLDGKLYAGTKANGVWRMALSAPGAWSAEAAGSGWQPTYTVRDLRVATTLCTGLLAATENGVWVLQ
ncbi:MAG: hypothetical protein U0350_08740 [Caldilineaceae bacterium]